MQLQLSLAYHVDNVSRACQGCALEVMSAALPMAPVAWFEQLYEDLNRRVRQEQRKHSAHPSTVTLPVQRCIKVAKVAAAAAAPTLPDSDSLDELADPPIDVKPVTLPSFTPLLTKISGKMPTAVAEREKCFA